MNDRKGGGGAGGSLPSAYEKRYWQQHVGSFGLPSPPKLLLACERNGACAQMLLQPNFVFNAYQPSSRVSVRTVVGVRSNGILHLLAEATVTDIFGVLNQRAHLFTTFAQRVACL